MAPPGTFSFNHGSGDNGIANFLTSCFLVSGLALPIVLLHGEVISLQASMLALFGGIVIYSSLIGYQFTFGANEDSVF